MRTALRAGEAFGETTFLPLGELAYLKSLPKLFPDLDGSIKFYPDLDVLILDFLGARYPGVAPGLDFLARAAGA